MFLNIVLSFLLILIMIFLCKRLILIMIFLCKRNSFEGFWSTTSQETPYPKPGNIPICNHSPGKHHHGICTCPEGTGLASLTADTCSPCQGDTYNDGRKQMCEGCGDNEVANRNKNACGCKDGTSRKQGTCQNCEAGTAGTNGNCYPCNGPTEYQPSAGQAACVPVGTGYYKYSNTTRGHCELQFYHNDQLHTHGDPWRSSGIQNGDCVTFAESSPAFYYDTTNWPYYEYRGWILAQSPRRVQILAKANGVNDTRNHPNCKLKSFSDKNCKNDEQSHTGPLETTHGDKRKFNYVQSIKWNL